MPIQSSGNASISQMRDGLIDPGFTSPTYASTSSFTVVGDVTSWLRPGREVVLNFQTAGLKRCVVTSLSYNSGTGKTTIYVAGDSLVSQTITSALLSSSSIPEQLAGRYAYGYDLETRSTTSTSYVWDTNLVLSVSAKANDIVFAIMRGQLRADNGWNQMQFALYSGSATQLINAEQISTNSGVWVPFSLNQAYRATADGTLQIAMRYLISASGGTAWITLRNGFAFVVGKWK